mmetsp:Transcript_12801/g.19203  ORF Transcript_12801/g.19203 Transcript_12801/m.19203 type:complete len:289 (-) Transcript_12801:101-967(-)
MFKAERHTKILRGVKRAVFDREQVYAILDENLIASISFSNDGDPKFLVHDDSKPEYYPTVLSTGYVRDGDSLLFHGKSSSLLQRRLASGIPICVSIFSLDGLVCAKTPMHHSVNYHAVIVYGQAFPVLDETEKCQALQIITDGLTWKGRTNECRKMNKAEIDATLVTRLPLLDGNISCKVRNAPPSDDADDLDFPCWAGNIPLRLASLTPIDAPHNNPKQKPPLTASSLSRGKLITPLHKILLSYSSVSFWRNLALFLAILLTALLIHHRHHHFPLLLPLYCGDSSSP